MEPDAWKSESSLSAGQETPNLTQSKSDYRNPSLALLRRQIGSLILGTTFILAIFWYYRPVKVVSVILAFWRKMFRNFLFLSVLELFTENYP